MNMCYETSNGGLQKNPHFNCVLFPVTDIPSDNVYAYALSKTLTKVSSPVTVGLYSECHNRINMVLKNIEGKLNYRICLPDVLQKSWIYWRFLHFISCFFSSYE